MSHLSPVDQVKLELSEMRRFGVDVPDAAFSLAETETVEGLDGGMSFSEIASLCIELAGIPAPEVAP